MKRILSCLLTLSLTGAVYSTICGANHVRIGDMTTYDGTMTNVSVYVTNDMNLYTMTIPLVLRSTTGGAFWTDFGGPVWDVRGGDPTNVMLFSADSVDFVSPDACLFSWIAGIFQVPISPGTDEPDSPSIVLNVTVGQNAGAIEIDTLIYPPSETLLFESNTVDVVPTFEKGIITVIPCDICPNQGDVAPLATSGDGIINVLDVIALIDYVFRSGPTPPQDGTCPRSRGDIDGGVGDDAVNILDVTYSIDHVFRSGPPPSDPCNP